MVPYSVPCRGQKEVKRKVSGKPKKRFLMFNNGRLKSDMQPGLDYGGKYRQNSLWTQGSTGKARQ